MEKLNRTRRLMMQADPRFDEIYDRGLALSGMEASKTRRKRFFNLTQFFTQVMDQKGDIAECGCWKGLSSFVMCSYLREFDKGFRGKGYHIFDSFEGLPSPSEEDSDSMGTPTVEGKYAATLDDVRRTLSDFPAISYHPGWIPESFRGARAKTYRFVHIDLDLYRSIRDSLRYFLPRLSPGGIIVCDDYASHKWPGARKAVDEFAARKRLRFLKITTGQAILLGPYLRP